jgi:hypothetical protein
MSSTPGSAGARYQRRPEYQRGLRNGFRPRRLQTAEGELELGIPQVREAAEPFVSQLFPRGAKLLRTEPLKAPRGMLPILGVTQAGETGCTPVVAPKNVDFMEQSRLLF